MARIRVAVVLGLALIAGSAFAWGTYQFVQRTPVEAATLATKPVLVAVSNLNVGAEVRAEDVRIVEWPASSLPANAIATPDQVVGRGVVMPIIQNEPILDSKLASKEMGAGLPPVIAPGKRALSVRVDDVIGVAGYVLPGTRVDVLATVNPTQQPTDVTSKVVLTNVQVLAAGTKIEQDVENGKPIAVSVVTLLVDPLESERLALAATEGKIQLALRNPLDNAAPVTPGIRPAGLMGSAPVRRAAAPRAAAPRVAAAPEPAPLPAVEIIRGDKRAQEVVAQ